MQDKLIISSLAIFAFVDPDNVVIKEAAWNNSGVYLSSGTTTYGDELTKIKIVSLPSKGQLKLGSTSVSVNDEITLANLSSLNYTAPPGKESGSGLASFGFKVSDGTDFSETFTCTMNVDPFYLPDLGAGNALKLENDYDGVKLPTGSVGSSYTLDFWIKPTGFTNGQYSTSNHKYHIFNRVFIDNAYKVSVYNGSGFSTTSTGLTQGEWNHVALVKRRDFFTCLYQRYGDRHLQLTEF